MIHWCIYVSLGLNELNDTNYVMICWCIYVSPGLNELNDTSVMINNEMVSPWDII